MTGARLGLQALFPNLEKATQKQLMAKALHLCTIQKQSFKELNLKFPFWNDEVDWLQFFVVSRREDWPLSYRRLAWRTWSIVYASSQSTSKPSRDGKAFNSMTREYKCTDVVLSGATQSKMVASSTIAWLFFFAVAERLKRTPTRLS